MIVNGMYFPQPRLVQGISENVSTSLLPTPTARDWKDTPGMAKQSGNRKRDDQLPRRIYVKLKSPAKCGGRLNPLFSLWLMGYPDGWLNPLYDALATPLSHKSPRSSEKAFLIK
jgi:hypothetical protein